MSIDYTLNNTTLRAQHIPEERAEVWEHYHDGAISATVHEHRLNERGRLEVSFNKYFLNDAGEAYRDEHEIYINQCDGLSEGEFLKRGFKPEHLKETWVPAYLISYPYELRSYKFERRFTEAELINRIRELEQ